MLVGVGEGGEGPSYELLVGIETGSAFLEDNLPFVSNVTGACVYATDIFPQVYDVNNITLSLEQELGELEDVTFYFLHSCMFMSW